jgi:hypothetical protein
MRLSAHPEAAADPAAQMRKNGFKSFLMVTTEKIVSQ